MRTTSIAILFLLGLGCQDPTNTSFTGNFRIKLVDAPAAFDQVNVVIRRVSVHRAGASAAFGWTIISEDVQTFDLLHLRNGVSATMVSATLPTGRYDKILLLLGTSNLVEEGFERTVEIPAGIRTGATIDVPFDIIEGSLMGLTFDMDVSRSVRTTPDGRFELHPVIRVQQTDLAGSIAGAVVPDSALATISTIAGEDSVSTLSLAQTGNNSFQLVDLPEGEYRVTITSLHPDFLDTTLTSVSVVPRQTTNIGAIPMRSRLPLP